METEFSLEINLGDSWTQFKPPRILKGNLQELKGVNLKRGQLYFSAATHSLIVPFAGRITPQLMRANAGGKLYAIGAVINVGDRNEQLELFLQEQILDGTLS